MTSLLANERYSLYIKKVSLVYKRPEIKASIEIILSVFTILILIFVAIRPTLTNIASLQKKIEDLEVINKKADNKISQLLAAEKQLKSFRSSLSLFDRAVPDLFSYSDSAKRVEYLARKNNLKIESVAFGGLILAGNKKIKYDWAEKIIQPTAENTLLDTVSFSLYGKPTNVIMFLREIENMDRLAILQNVSLNKQIGRSREEDTLRATGQVTFYFYSQKL